MKRKRKSNGPFVAVPKAIMATPAWRAMSPGGRLLWIELRGWLRNDGSNNGKAYLACRDAAKAIGTKSKGSIVRWYAENKHYGFVRKTAEGFLGLDGRGIAAHYRFTDLAHGTHPPTRDFEKWDGEPFAYTPRRDARKKQNPVPTMGTPRTHHRDIRKPGNGGSVCTHHGYIRDAPRCTHHGDRSRFPYPTSKEEQLQGSSTARAPVQAGGAGSSPAPVSSLTEYVLSVVNAELDRTPGPRLRHNKPALGPQLSIIRFPSSSHTPPERCSRNAVGTPSTRREHSFYDAKQPREATPPRAFPPQAPQSTNGGERGVRHCDHCGQPDTAADPLHHGHWRPRKPDGDWLHAGCIDPWRAGGWRLK